VGEAAGTGRPGRFRGQEGGRRTKPQPRQAASRKFGSIAPLADQRVAADVQASRRQRFLRSSNGGRTTFVPGAKASSSGVRGPIESDPEDSGSNNPVSKLSRESKKEKQKKQAGVGCHATRSRSSSTDAFHHDSAAGELVPLPLWNMNSEIEKPEGSTFFEDEIAARYEYWKKKNRKNTRG